MQIVILPGWGQNKKHWVHNVRQLSKIGPIKAIDLPGFGEELLVSDEWGIPEYANWVSNLINKNKMKDVVLIGHSFGGKIASYLSSQNPAWLKALILVATPALYRPSLFVRSKIALYKIIKRIVPNSIREVFYSEELKEAKKQGMEKILRKVVPFDQTLLLTKIRVPTLLIWGENDDYPPISIGKEINSLIPNSKLKVIEDAGHQINIQKPLLLYANIKNFIESL